jgi:hypothetical protein
VQIDAEIHLAARAAVPLPGKLAQWTPLQVSVNGRPAAALRREGGSLWIALDPGVQRVRITGRLEEISEWQWAFELLPHRVTVDAPGWNVTGVGPDGIPEGQIFLTRQQKALTREASYDRRDYAALALVERTLELGLQWKLRTQVLRQSSAGQALSLRIPLLPGERVLSSNIIVTEGAVEVRLGAQDQVLAWDSELSIAPRLELKTRTEDTWVERWLLVSSPIWNIGVSGLAPIFTATENRLLPVWRPWPGEQVTLTLSRPEAVAGPNLTIKYVRAEERLGPRHRTGQLDFAAECSVGQDLALRLAEDLEILSVTLAQQPLPVRREGGQLIIPLRIGSQNVQVNWTRNRALEAITLAEPIRFPLEVTNLTTVLHVPESHWILWTWGPQQGPAVRLWTILLVALLAAGVAGRLTFSPLRTWEWILLGVGLTQVPPFAGLWVVAWFFLLAWRGREQLRTWPGWTFNLLQIAIVGSTLIALGIFLLIAHAGLLGNPEMYIQGNSSSATTLNWFQASSNGDLPQPLTLSISIWWYRLAMLLWALWLASALIRWLRLAGQSLLHGGWWRNWRKSVIKDQ